MSSFSESIARDVCKHYFACPQCPVYELCRGPDYFTTLNQIMEHNKALWELATEYLNEKNNA